MSEADKVFAGSVPENYDRYMVPLIFEPYVGQSILSRRHAGRSGDGQCGPERRP